MPKWTADDIPPQTGRRAVVTGATGGIGYETALALARKGAHVLLAGRSETKGAGAVERIAAQVPGAAVRFEKVDLADLGSVAALASRLLDERQPVDLLINNAGVMTPPTRYATADGFELQFGTNYLSHFALTARLLPLLEPTRKPRVVHLSSGAHRLGGAIHFDDLQWERAYKPWLAYAQSKLAMLMFALELQRRSDENGWGLISNAAHPGWAMTGLQSSGPRLGRENRTSFAERLAQVTGPLFGQSAAAGALPTLFAATAPEATGAAYYGPDGVFELKGSPAPAFIAPQAKDGVAASRLWELSENLTGVRWPSTEVRLSL